MGLSRHSHVPQKTRQIQESDDEADDEEQPPLKIVMLGIMTKQQEHTLTLLKSAQLILACQDTTTKKK